MEACYVCGRSSGVVCWGCARPICANEYSAGAVMVDVLDGSGRYVRSYGALLCPECRLRRFRRGRRDGSPSPLLLPQHAERDARTIDVGPG